MKKDQVLIFGLCGESVFMSCDHFHHNGETIVINDLYREPGGKGYNQAVACQNMGVDCIFVGAVGNDSSADMCEEYLTSVGVRHTLIRKPGKSAYATILTDKEGNNQVSVFPGASNLLSVDDIAKLEHLFVESKMLLLQLELPEDTLNKIIELAVKYQVQIVLNPAPYKDYINKFINNCFLITPNFHEALSIFGLPLDSTIDNLENELVRFNKNIKIIVTLGKDGALYVENDRIERIAPLFIDQSLVVDTTGAGDVFNGCLVAHLIKGYSIKEAIEKAIKASGLSVQKKYVMPSIPKLGDLCE